MADLDRDRVLRYEVEIKEARNLLATITSEDVEETVRDNTKVGSLKYTLIVPAEAICNLCRHILAKKAFFAVEEYVESILKMQEKGFLSDEVANRLIPLMKLRHQLIHGYWKTDNKRLLLETRDSLDTIDAFLSEIQRIISTSESF